LLKGDIKIQDVPTHIAIIMDGNSRWAKSNKLPTKAGHKKGSQNIEKIAKYCIEFGVKYLTIYAFSSENWDRPQKEVDYLMNLLDEYLDSGAKKLVKNNIKVLISGKLDKLSSSTRQKICKLEEESAQNSALILNVAFGYGARQEIVDATKKIALALREGSISLESINEELVQNNLYKPQIPDPDLLIRTAGDLRVSNFLLWQLAYSELYFTKVFWPSFGKKELKLAIEDFNKRQRRYGKR